MRRRIVPVLILSFLTFVVVTPGGAQQPAQSQGLRSPDVVYDLGCGDGRIPIAAAKTYGARGVGIDIDPERIREANANAKEAGVTDKVKFINGDLFTADISEATVVTLYLLPSLNEKLIPKLKSELKPGARIVSHQFDMGAGWPPDETQQINGRTIYLWRIGGK